MSELENVAYEHNCQAGTDKGRHDDGHDQHESQEASPGIGIDHSINPGVLCPKTVLVAVMTDVSYLLMSYPQREPAAFVTRDDAGPLRDALQGAFGTPADATVSGNDNSKHTSTVPPGHEALCTKQVRR